MLSPQLFALLVAKYLGSMADSVQVIAWMLVVLTMIRTITFARDLYEDWQYRVRKSKY